MNNNDSLIINLLNIMYNDNIRQIQALQQSNIEIRNMIYNETNYQVRRNRNGNSNTNFNRNRNRNTNVYKNVYRNASSNASINNVINNTNPYINNNVEYQRYLPRPVQEPIAPRFNNIEINDFFEPIPIYPTPTQIELATRVVRYGDIINPLNASCPIFIESFNENDYVTMIRHCGHIFATTGIQNWFRNNCRCPVCRYDIRNYSLPSNLSTPLRNNVLQTTDLSGNLIDSITDTILHELMNSNPTALNYTIDASDNYAETTLATFYFTLPPRR